jgi:hypothetical protein
VGGHQPAEAIEPLAMLLGTWRGRGSGRYPTIRPFEYREELRLWDSGKPVVASSLESWSMSGDPFHQEMGFWRPEPDGRLSVVLSHALGVVEVAEGAIDGGSISLASTSIVRAPGGSAVKSLERRYRVEGDTLSYELWMETDSTPLALHLTGRLRRR